MSGERVERRLAAILAADVAGYSRLMGEDEAGTLARLRTHRREQIDPQVNEHRGRIVKTTGDGILVEFPSVVEAVACAVAVQRAMADRNSGTPEDQRIVFRVGVNLGDIIVEGDDIHGDGVNVAARLEGLAEPGGICISGTVRDHIGDRLDLAFEDMGEQLLKNIARPLRVYRVRLASVDNTPMSNVGTPALSLPDKPSLAVLPFQNMSGDPEQEYFADGMAEDITTAIARLPWLFVIARNSSFAYKGKSPDLRQVGRELGVRYVLEGSVRKAGNRVRITGQLIDTTTGTHIWADRFDGSLDDIFELQDQVASSVVGAIEPKLRQSEIERATRKSTNSLDAYDLYLRALAAFFPTTKERVLEALGLFEKAIATDPHYGPALSWAAVCHLRLVVDGWAEEPETNRRKGTALARRALDVGEKDSRILVNAAFVLAQFGEDHGAMIALVDRALALNPSFARGWNMSGSLRIFAGQPDVAIEHLETALRLSPLERFGSPLTTIGAAYFYTRQFNEAASRLLLAIQDSPGFPTPYRILASCYAHMGRLYKARAIVAQLRAITSEVLPNSVAAPRNPEYRELLLSGLRLAMGEAR